MQKINYGIDAAPFMRTAFMIGSVLLPIGLFLQIAYHSLFAIPFLIAGFIPLFLGTVMYFYGKNGKFLMRDYVLSLVNWRGDEQVLDIGSGLGLMLNGAAKKLTTGKAIGIDVWVVKDLSDNSLENALRNAELEGVRDKIEIRTEDAQKLNFSDNQFDVILSMLCLHNIEEDGGIEKACFEIARVLKPNGVALIGDYLPTHAYAKFFKKAGLTVKYSKPFFSIAYSPMWLVEVVK